MGTHDDGTTGLTILAFTLFSLYVAAWAESRRLDAEITPAQIVVTAMLQ